jgi:hypothetical protein
MLSRLPMSRVYHMLTHRGHCCAEPREDLEPETHIERYGIDHYLSTIFPYDTPLKRRARKEQLLSFPCLAAREIRFQNKITLKFEIS